MDLNQRAVAALVPFFSERGLSLATGSLVFIAPGSRDARAGGVGPETSTTTL